MFNSSNKGNDPKKHFVNIIKNIGSPNSLIYKYHVEDFNNNSSIIIDEGQEAVFFSGGKVEGVLPPGSHTLNTSNYPFLTRIKTIISGGESKYNCKVYFVRKNITKEYTWGTAEPIQVRDPVENIMAKIRANGAYNLQITDSKRFITGLSSTLYSSFDEYTVSNFIKNQFISVINSCIAGYIKESNEEIIGINTKKDIIAEKIKGVLESKVSEYGLTIRTFVINVITVDEDEYRRDVEKANAKMSVSKKEFDIKRLEAAGDAEVMKIMAQGEKDRAQILGMSADEMLRYGILERFAENSNGAPAAAAVITGLETGQGVAGMMNSFFATDNQKVSKVSSDPSEFAQVNNDNQMMQELSSLKNELAICSITEEEYNKRRDEILKKYGL